MKKTILASAALTLGIAGIGAGGVASANNGSEAVHSENVDNYNGVQKSETQDQNDSGIVEETKAGKKDGGFWIRGKRGNKVISDYKHYKKSGKGTAINGKGRVGSGGWKPAGTFSKGRVGKTWSGNQSYYSHK